MSALFGDSAAHGTHETMRAPSVCSCGHPPTAQPIGSCGTGYARTRDGRTLCYACADAAEREELRSRSGVFCAYLSSDGQRATTWTGGTLGTVVSSRPCKLTRRSYTHDASEYRSVTVRDVHGAYWHGRGSPGISIRLRPSKAGAT